jgi:hypothetical protein
MSSTNNGGNDGDEAFTIDTGGINLVSGNQYVAFFSASNYFDGIPGTSRVLIAYDSNGGNVYSGGDAVYLNNGNDFSRIWTSDWVTLSCYDLALTMNFSEPAPVPEPNTMLLMGLGLAGLIGIRSRRKS